MGSLTVTVEAASVSEAVTEHQF